MQNESTHQNPKSKPVLVRTLIPVGWTLLGILTLATLYMMVRVSTERTTSPEAGRGLGIYVVLFMMGIVALMGWLFSIAARKQSTAGLITMTFLLTYPLAMLVARPIVLAYKSWKWERESGRVGVFPDQALRALAKGAKSNDTC
jgi:hypothetical protein